MRIVIDLRTSHKTGVFRYGTNIVKSIMKNYRKNNYLIIHNSVNENELFELLEVRGQCIEFYFPKSDWLFFRDCNEIREKIHNWKADIYYSVNYMIDWKISAPIVSTIHDLIRIKFPELSYTEETFCKKFGLNEHNKLASIFNTIENPLDINQKFLSVFFDLTKKIIDASSTVVTCSAISKDDIAEVYKVKQDEKIEVIPAAVRQDIFCKRTSDEIITIKDKYNIIGDYVVYVGLAHPHKRLDLILKVLSLNIGDIPTDSKLVIVGNKADIIGKLGQYILDEKLQSSIIFAEGISDDELACIYSGAEALIIASIYEGFCLPALEALSCGTEVISTDIPVIRDNLKDYCHYYSSNDVDLLKALTNKALNKKLENKNIEFNNLFSWNKASNRLMDIFMKIGGRKK